MKTYHQFLFENMVLNFAPLLDSIKAKKLNSEKIFIKLDKFTDLNELYNDMTFNKKLQSKGFYKDNLEVTKEYETFLRDSLTVRYFLLYKNNQSELETPKYIYLQTKSGGKWSQIGFYSINSDMQNFYNILTNKIIEINFNGVKYKYKTSNGGNDWTLQNKENKNNIFKDILKTEEIDNILSDVNVTVKEIF
jgi:hypothetical protein